MQFFALLTLAASAMAYQVTYPTAGTNWTSVGPNKFTWDRVNTDAQNFTLLLTNTDQSVMPQNNLQLAALIDGTLGSFSVNPPSTFFPVGKGFRLNLVKDTESQSSIYAQSDQFDIINSPQSSSRISSGSVTATGVVATTANNAATTAAASTDAASGSDSALNPTASSKNGAAQTVRSGALGLAVIGAIAYIL